ncbi:cyclic nucleotide-binding domain-containing protein [Phenylobacterium sp.]|uniref:cyclic nucleotide-binding domain-containing protein n=1 Tax=Phenylobacterium sp. TaxID=1871053 RepID=UPI002D19D475|nr:cyclic nucleotide-binding domain-containing protein [Phenylobacterium sp.]HLZ75697.1 cyclic nucleotide-binding domain-containing protein [Phenylobacterium sp.]
MSSHVETGAAGGIGPDLIEALRASLTAFAVEPGELLFRQNDPADGMHVIAQGRIRVQGRTLADGLVQLAEVGPGDIVGEFSLIDLGRRSATAEAVEATSGHFLAREQFERLIFMGDAAATGLARHIRHLACARTRSTIAAIAQTPSGAAEMRPAPPAQASAKARAKDGAAAMLQALHQFSHFRPEEIAQLLRAAAVADAARGVVLAAPASPPDGLWVILRGAVRTGLPLGGGIEQLLIHGPGKIVGAVAAIDGGPQPAQLDVREDAILIHLPQERMAKLEADAGSAAVKLVDMVSKQLTADLRALSRRQGRQRSMAALNARRASGEAAHV